MSQTCANSHIEKKKHYVTNTFNHHLGRGGVKEGGGTGRRKRRSTSLGYEVPAVLKTKFEDSTVDNNISAICLKQHIPNC